MLWREPLSKAQPMAEPSLPMSVWGSDGYRAGVCRRLRDLLPAEATRTPFDFCGLHLITVRCRSETTRHSI
jgi:hypothetical protein